MIPLSSDTETHPTQAMRQAMAAAPVGDEQKGTDPTVNRLQDRVAELLGKEAALWLPTGTLCNLVAIRTHTRPGDVVIVEAMAHIIRAEAAGAPVSAGVLLEPIPSRRGIFSGEDLRQAQDRTRATSYPHAAPARLVCLEQTHNFGGGSVWSLDELAQVSETARELDLALHMDGARLFNACVAHGVAPHRYAAQVDSLWIDFTKGLGAPVGAVLAGERDFIKEARRQKHICAGAMRQAGIVAAGCLYALDHHVERLAEDHANARRLADALAAIPGIHVRTPRPETNMVFFQVETPGVSHRDVVSALKARGLEMSPVRGGIRAVTHLDVSTEDIDAAVEIVRRVIATL